MAKLSGNIEIRDIFLRGISRQAPLSSIVFRISSPLLGVDKELIAVVKLDENFVRLNDGRGYFFQ